ncbi:hypothetical protein MOLA814_00369 [Betaproteobacteria bacterium MOLA814]|nr:hypothetical protein MOLA814_00369 [Betaproteobacteria bacterium MOLA814]
MRFALSMMCRIVFVTPYKLPATEDGKPEFESARQRVITVQYAGNMGVLVSMLDVKGWGRRISINHGFDACFLINE